MLAARSWRGACGAASQQRGLADAACRSYGFRDVYTVQDIQAWAPPVYPFAKLDPKWHEAGAVRVS